MRKRLLNLLTVAAAFAGSLAVSISAMAANGADPRGVMPFAADSTGNGVSFVINNGDLFERNPTDDSRITFTTDKNLRFSSYDPTDYFKSVRYNNGSYSGTNGNIYPVGYDFWTGDTIVTGHVKDKIVAPEGYHTYDYEKLEGEIVVSRWEINYPVAACIHAPGVKDEDGNPTTFWRDIQHNHLDVEYDKTVSADGWGYVLSTCMQKFDNVTRGWEWYCAECGQTDGNIHYMTADTASKLYAFDASYYYYYTCPWNGNLETAFQEKHWCLAISPNRYQVVYAPNGGAGLMSNTMHLYDNGGEYGFTYDGRPYAAQTKLRKNTFNRNGYVFVGWNTEPDGSGESFTDGQEILNLTSVNNGKVTLYAQWKATSDNLTVNADDRNGHVGTYDGKPSASYNVPYLDSKDVLHDLAVAPEGFRVEFDLKGGTLEGMDKTGLVDINGNTGKTIVSVNPIEEWDMSDFIITNWKSDFSEGKITATNNNASTPENPIIRITYKDLPFVLPDAKKDNQVFVGWEITSDPGTDEDVHQPGEGITPSKDLADKDGVIRLEAKYGNLSASVVPDYKLTVNDGDGSVDINWDWTQSSSFPLYYKLFESDASHANLNAIDIGGGNAEQVINTGVSNIASDGTYTATKAGVYVITANGSNGASSGNKTGGSGREVSGQIWLNEGDQIIYRRVKGGTSSAADAGGNGGVRGSAGSSFDSKNMNTNTKIFSKNSLTIKRDYDKINYQCYFVSQYIIACYAAAKMKMS